MQIIQFQLGSQVNPLGLRSPLADSRRLLLRKADSTFIKPIVSQSPLVTVSKFLLARKYKTFIDQLIGENNWNNQDSDTEFPVIEFDPFDAIQQDRGNYNNAEESKANIPNILPTPRESYGSNDISPELNISAKATKSTKPSKTQSKSQTKSSSKSPAKSNTKSPAKSQTKKSVKSSLTKKVEQVVDEIPTHIHHQEGLLIPEQPLTRAPNSEIDRFQDNYSLFPNDNEGGWLIPEQPLTTAPNSEIDRFQDNALVLPNDIDLDNNINNHLNDSDSLKNSPIQTVKAGTILEEESTGFKNFAKDELQVIPESPSTLPSAESSTTVNAFDVPQSMMPVQRNPNLDSSTSDLSQSSPIEPTSPHVGETHTLLNNLAKNEQPLVTQASLVVDVSDIPVSPTSPQEEISTSQIPPIADNQSTSPSSAFIQKIAVTPPQEAELLHTNSNFEENTVIQPDLISNNVINDAVIDNGGVNNYVDNLPLSGTNTSLSVEDTSILFQNLANDQQPIVSELSSILPSAESAKTVNATPVVIQPLLTATNSPASAEITTTDSTVVESAIAPSTSSENSQVISSPNKYPQHQETPPPTPKRTRLGGVEFFDDEMTSPETSSEEVEQNTVSDKLPAPQGYATGGQVTASSVENHPQIAPSDTVPAMLTPGEFVINATDAQKNLHILRQINSGATPENVILPTVETANLQKQAEITSPETPTKVDTFADTSIQRQNDDINPSGESNSFTPASLGVEIGKQRLSMFSTPQLNPVENTTTGVGEPSPHYSSPTLIFRKPNPTTNATTNTPSQWSSVEELLYGSNDEFTSFNFGGAESNWQNSEFSQVSQSSSTAPQIFTKRLTTARGFADGGEVTAPDISRDIQPITETIQNPFAGEEKDNNDDVNIEILAHEIYNRLRQRIEIERERHGISLGRLPW